MWCPAVLGFGKLGMFLCLKLWQKASSLHILPVLLGLVAC